MSTAESRPAETRHHLVAAVDLGSNSFRLLIAAVQEGPAGRQIRIVDQIKETVRLGAGLDRKMELSQPAQQRALEALARFSERIRSFAPDRVRAVATNTFRVARNAGEFIIAARAVLGFPIEVVAGREEARLIYLGAAQDLPDDGEKRLVIDIGGGSTECIIGIDDEPLRRESLQMGCVSTTRQFFADGRIQRHSMRAARLYCRERIAAEVRAFRRLGWSYAVGTSGTAKSLAQIAQAGSGTPRITAESLARLEAMLIATGDIESIDIPGLKPDRRPVIAGGLAVMQALFEEFRIDSLAFCDSALREGVLHDLLGRDIGADRREATIAGWVERYQLDAQHGAEVAEVAADLYRQLLGGRPGSESGSGFGSGSGSNPGNGNGSDGVGPRLRLLRWAARIREIGASIAHDNAHKHGAYILAHADMPGFSHEEQRLLSMLVLGQSGGLRKLQAHAPSDDDWAMILALRLAVILQRRRDGRPTPIRLTPARAAPPGSWAAENGWKVELPAAWVSEHPLTDQSLQDEAQEWRSSGPVRVATYRVA